MQGIRTPDVSRIEDLGKQVVVLTGDIEHLGAFLRDRTDTVRAEQTEIRSELQSLAIAQEGLKQKVSTLERFEHTRIPVHTQRLNHLEKLLDESRTRRWQVWLAFCSAAMSAIVALTVAFAKK